MRTEAAPAPSFLRHVCVLAGATALGPLVGLLASPLLTRLYGPAEFGVLGLFEAVLAMTLTVCTLRFHLAIPIPEDDADAVGLLLAAVVATFGFSALLAIAIGLAGEPLADRLHLRAIGHVLWLLPVATCAGGLALSLAGWQVRRREFARIAVARVTQGGVQSATQLGFGAAGALATGLCLGLAAGRIAAATLLAMRTGLLSWLADVSLDRVRAAARHHWRLPLVSSWSAIVHVAGQQVSVLIVGAAFGAGPAGFFSLAFLVVVGPGHVVCQAVEQSFAARLRDAEREAVVPALSFAVFRSLVVAGVVPTMIFTVIAPDVFGLVFGRDWTRAGEYAALLAPSVLAAVVGAHLPGVVVLRRWQRAELVFNVVLATVRCAALGWGARIGDASPAVLAWGVASAVLTFGYSVGQLVAQGIAVSTIGAVVGREVARGAVIVAGLLLMRGFDDGAHPVVVATLGALIAVVWVVVAPRRAMADVDATVATA